MRGRRYLRRYLPPVAFLAAATIAVLLIRAGVRDDKPAAPPSSGNTPQVLVSRSSARPAKALRKRFYVIRAGDTLDAVAQRFRTSVERLLVLNPGVEPTSLRIGQRIRTT